MYPSVSALRAPCLQVPERARRRDVPEYYAMPCLQGTVEAARVQGNCATQAAIRFALPRVGSELSGGPASLKVQGSVYRQMAV